MREREREKHLYNYNGIYSSGSHNNLKCLSTKQQSSKVHKTNQVDLKEVDKFIIIDEDFNIPLSVIDRTNRQKNQK